MEAFSCLNPKVYSKQPIYQSITYIINIDIAFILEVQSRDHHTNKIHTHIQALNKTKRKTERGSRIEPTSGLEAGERISSGGE